MEQKIYAVLNEVGIPHSLIGRDYIEKAIVIIKQRGRVSMSKELYPLVAKEFNSTPQRVERAIRHSIIRALENTNKDAIVKIFGNTFSFKKSKFTNTDFIFGIVRYLNFQD